MSRLKAQLEETLQEKGAALRDRTAAIRERDGLKQQCTAAIRQWDNALRERNEFKEAFIKVGAAPGWAVVVDGSGMRWDEMGWGEVGGDGVG